MSRREGFSEILYTMENPEVTQQSYEASVEPESLYPDYSNPSYVMPDIIEVNVISRLEGEEDSYFFPVQIVKAAKNSKSYLGGFRNKVNGQIYHHASTQTPTDSKKPKKINHNASTRETQTYEVRSLSIQPYREFGTQMERGNLSIDNKDDKILESKPYETSETLMQRKKKSTIEIQRYWRGYMARVRAHEIRERNAAYARAKEEEKLDQTNQLMKTAKETLARRTNPKTNADFALLYNELDSWRKAEIAKIKSTVKGEKELQDAMSALLNHETQALQTMQQLKLNAQRSVHEEKTMSMLSEMSKPHQWQLSRGEIANVQTPETIKAKELLELYQKLLHPVTSVDVRIEILLSCKWAVSNHNSAIIRDIQDLVDREADLLNRGRPIKSMEGLRTRLLHLFLEFIQNPLYNPRAKDFLKK